MKKSVVLATNETYLGSHKNCVESVKRIKILVSNNPKISNRPRVLIVMHQETSSPGRVGMVLQNMGFDLVECRPVLGDELPSTLEEYSGAVVFGGPMSANDPDDYIKKEIDWMDVPLKEEKPFLGVCLGAQMLSKHLGGEVTPHEKELVEIGYYPIEATQEGKAFMDWPNQVYQWHREGFTLPKTATLLATGDEYPNQAYKYGKNAYGVQFHSEVSHLMMNKWTTKAWERLLLPGAQNRNEQFENRLRYDAEVRKWLAEFLELWIGNPNKPS